MNKESYDTKSKNKRPQKELMTGPQTLIVGDVTVKEVNSFCSKKNTKVLCFDTIWSLTSQKKFWTSLLNIQQRNLSSYTQGPVMLWSNNLRYWNKTSLICWSKSDLSILWCLSVALYQLSVEVMRDSAGCWCWTAGSKLHVMLNQWTLLTILTFSGNADISLRQMDSALTSQE